MIIQCVLNPVESKKLIALGVMSLPEVKAAMKIGTIIVSWGSTCSYIAEALTGEPVAPEDFMAGYIGDGELKVSDGENRKVPVVLRDGKKADIPPKDALESFGGGDVFIKGANAVDLEGNAGILLRHESGGTIGMALGILSARGSHLIIPVGLEKLIPSVYEASRVCGLERVEKATGVTVGLMPVMYGRCFTEIDAVVLLSGAEAVHIASGGLGESQGAVTLSIFGEDGTVRKAAGIIDEIKHG